MKQILSTHKRSNGVSVIVPAAGLGRRFEESRGGLYGRPERASTANRAGTRPVPTTPKLFSRIGHLPLISHVLSAFDSLPFVREIIVAVEPKSMKRFRREVLSYVGAPLSATKTADTSSGGVGARKGQAQGLSLQKPIVLVAGGKTRAESVWNALKRVSRKSRYVCVHDAARPLIKPEWLIQLMRNVNGWDAVLLGRRAVETVKVFEPASGKIERTLDRNQIFEAETPQLVKKEAFLKSYEILGLKRAFQATDDVSLIEEAGGRIKGVAHLEPNIKVTTYQDLAVVQNLMEGELGVGGAAPLRFGLGFDRHRLVSKRIFYLGGVRIPSPVGPLGHSDGDPLLHAITDAILGSVGAGDIGDLFPDSSRKWKGVRSGHFLREALARAREKGFRPAQVDATIFLERPKLGMYKKKIQAHVARLLQLSSSEVSIKAKTAEGLGPEGLGEAVSCQALVVLAEHE